MTSPLCWREWSRSMLIPTAPFSVAVAAVVEARTGEEMSVPRNDPPIDFVGAGFVIAEALRSVASMAGKFVGAQRTAEGQFQGNTMDRELPAAVSHSPVPSLAGIGPGPDPTVANDGRPGSKHSSQFFDFGLSGAGVATEPATGLPDLAGLSCERTTAVGADPLQPLLVSRCLPAVPRAEESATLADLTRVAQKGLAAAFAGVANLDGLLILAGSPAEPPAAFADPCCVDLEDLAAPFAGAQHARLIRHGESPVRRVALPAASTLRGSICMPDFTTSRVLT